MKKMAIKRAYKNLEEGIKECKGVKSKKLSGILNGMKSSKKMLKATLTHLDKKDGKAKAQGTYYSAIKTISQLLGQLKEEDDKTAKKMKKFIGGSLRTLKKSA